MAAQIQLRRDTSANWTSVNPILANGEPGVETDTGRQKVGDGTTAWTLLPYTGTAIQNNFTKTQTWNKAANIASATTVALPADGNTVHITGTATITDFTVPAGIPSSAAGSWTLIADAAWSVTHSAGVIDVVGGASITMAAGDVVVVWQDGVTFRVAKLAAIGVANGAASLDANTEVVELSAGAAAEVTAGRLTSVKQANGTWAVPAAGGGGGGGATGGGTDAVFQENDQAVTANYTLTAGKNAMSAGTITINTGVTVTVPTGANWVIV